MNPIRQIAHIVIKDIRGHALEIAFLLLLNLSFVVVVTESWTEVIASGPSLTVGVVEMVLQLALVVIWSLLIAQVVQADTPMAREAYWLTRPLSRLAVPGAKLAFVLLVMHLPAFVAQAAIVILSGVPLSVGQLLLNQAVVLAYLSLPMMLIASVTRSLAQFILAAVGFTAVVMTMQSRLIGRFVVTDDLLDPIPIPIAAWMLLIALVAGAALFWQYRKRRTLIVAAICTVALFVLFRVTVAIPETVMHWGRSMSLGPLTAAPEIAFLPSAARPGSAGAAPFPFNAVALPLELSRPENVVFERVQVQLRTLTGPERRFQGGGWLRSFGDGWWLTFPIPQRFHEGEVSIRIVIDGGEYTVRESEAIPLDGRPAIVDGRAQCGAVTVDNDSAQVICRTSFQRSVWSLERGRQVAVATGTREPFRFSLDPIMTELVTATPVLVEGAATELATNTRTLTGYGRQVVEIDRVRLADWIGE